MNKLIILALASSFSSVVLAHGNVDLSNGSQIEIYKANEYEYAAHDGHGHTDEKQSYGIEAIFMAENGLFVYAEGETGAHDFYQVGGGKYMNINDDLGVFVYGAYASGGYNNGNELRARVGADYQVMHGFAVHTYLGYDYGNSKMALDDEHEHEGYSADDIHSSERSHILRADLGFSKEIGSVAEFSFNYVIQEQLEGELIADNSTNLHYEARITYTETALRPYIEFRQTGQSFDEEHYEDKAIQFGVNFSF